MRGSVAQMTSGRPAGSPVPRSLSNRTEPIPPAPSPAWRVTVNCPPGGRLPLSNAAEWVRAGARPDAGVFLNWLRPLRLHSRTGMLVPTGGLARSATGTRRRSPWVVGETTNGPVRTACADCPSGRQVELHVIVPGPVRWTPQSGCGTFSPPPSPAPIPGPMGGNGLPARSFCGKLPELTC